MFEEIRKPKLLQDTPMIIIRALPSIYYYLKFNKTNAPGIARELYITNLRYLGEACGQMGEYSDERRFASIADRIRSGYQDEKAFTFDHFALLVIELAGLFSTHKSRLREKQKEFRPVLIELYLRLVKQLQILLVDNAGEPERCSVILNNLISFCHYRATIDLPGSGTYVEHILESEFYIVSSTRPADVHELVKLLTTYSKPGLAMVYLSKEPDADQRSVRHGAQLGRTGFPVLYKVFTPIRLFTTIEKAFMRFHC